MTFRVVEVDVRNFRRNFNSLSTNQRRVLSRFESPSGRYLTVDDADVDEAIIDLLEVDGYIESVSSASAVRLLQLTPKGCDTTLAVPLPDTAGVRAATRTRP